MIIRGGKVVGGVRVGSYHKFTKNNFAFHESQNNFNFGHVFT